MKRTLCAELSQKSGEKILIKGFLHIKRDHGSVAFLILRDRTGKAQIVVEGEALLKKISLCMEGSVLEVEGIVSKSNSKNFPYEILCSEIIVLSEVKIAMPIELSKPKLNVHIDTDLDYRSVILRHERYRAIFKIQSRLAQAYREFMIKDGATEYFAPAMISASSEGGSEVFKVPYFDSEATLAQSSQLFKQILVGVYERVFSIAKCFRAENSNTRRHLTEATQYEFEMGFIDSIDDVMDKLDSVVRFMIEKVKEDCAEELSVLKVTLPMIPEGKFPRLNFQDVKIILKERMKTETSFLKDMTTEGERELCAYAREKYGSDFVFVTNFEKGAFYCFRDEKGVYQNFDLLCREAEIVSGGRRIENYEKLVEAIKGNGMSLDGFSEYLAVFKYGMPAHGGFGLGLERSTMIFLGLENIREAVMFPSDPKRIASKKTLSDE